MYKFFHLLDVVNTLSESCRDTPDCSESSHVLKDDIFLTEDHIFQCNTIYIKRPCLSSFKGVLQSPKIERTVLDLIGTPIEHWS